MVVCAAFGARAGWKRMKKRMSASTSFGGSAEKRALSSPIPPIRRAPSAQ
jgi:hypothetical protein